MSPTSAQDPAASADRAPEVNWRVAFLLFTRPGCCGPVLLSRRPHTRDAGTLVRRVLEESTGVRSAAPVPVHRRDRAPLSVDSGPVACELARARAHLPCIQRGAHDAARAQPARALSALGHGTYDYGLMSVRYFMESAEDVISYTVLVGILTLMRVQRRLRDREVRAATLERDAANGAARGSEPAAPAAFPVQRAQHDLLHRLRRPRRRRRHDRPARRSAASRAADERASGSAARRGAGDAATHISRSSRHGSATASAVDSMSGRTAVAIGVPALLAAAARRERRRHGAASEFGEHRDPRSGSRCRWRATCEIVIENDGGRRASPADCARRHGTRHDARPPAPARTATRRRSTPCAIRRSLSRDGAASRAPRCRAGATPLPIAEHARAHR